MRLVHVEQQVGMVAFQTDEAWQVGFVSVHAEYAFRCDDDPLVAVAVLVDQPRQLLHVVVTVADAARGREAHAVYQAGMH